jgi:hypothetical protein
MTLAEDREASLKRRLSEDTDYLQRLNGIKEAEAKLCDDFADLVDAGKASSW